MDNRVMEVVQLVANVTVALVAFGTGIGAASANGRWLWHRPRLLWRSLFAVLIVVPALAILLVKIIAPPAPVGAGLVVTAIAIGPVMALKRTRKGGAQLSYPLGLNVLLLVVSLAFVPGAAWALGALFHRDVPLQAVDVMKVVLPLQLLPLTAGVAFGRVAPRLSARLEKPLNLTTTAVIGLLGAVVLVALFKPMIALGSVGFVTLVLLAVCAVAAGHLLGGPDASTRPVLATFSALRFPALAISLAELTAQGRKVVPVVVAYLLVSLGVLVLYGALTRLATRLTKHPPAPTAAASTR